MIIEGKNKENMKGEECPLCWCCDAVCVYRALRVCARGGRRGRRGAIETHSQYVSDEHRCAVATLVRGEERRGKERKRKERHRHLRVYSPEVQDARNLECVER